MKPIKAYSAAALLAFASGHAYAYDFAVDSIYYNITSDTDLSVEVTYEKSGYNSYSGDVGIPANGETVTVPNGGLYIIRAGNQTTKAVF